MEELIRQNGAYMGQGEKQRAMKLDTRSMVPLARSLQAAPQAQAMAAPYTPAGPLGLDVSGWQPNVDWAAQARLGAKFAYVKASEGNYMTSSAFNSQYVGARQAGLIRGAYHFAIPSVSSASAQADFFVSHGGGWSNDGWTLPPLLDIEYSPDPAYGNMCYNFSASAMVSWIKDFSNRMSARTGRLPMIYTTADWWSQCTGNSSAFSNQPLHIAAYATSVTRIPASWSTYSVWQYSSTGPFDGDSNVWNGTAASLKTFASKADATTPPSPAAPPAVKPSITSPADVVAIDSAGALWNYPAAGNGTVGARKQIGTGWKGLRSITVIDWNADGVLDIVAQWNSGGVTLYRGLSTGGFVSSTTLAASGWNNYQLTIGYWLNASNYPQILTRSATGDLKLWKNTSGAGLDAGKQIGQGWGALNLTMVDFDGDGKQDILAQDPAGSLRLFRLNGTGAFVDESRKTVGSGWAGFTSVTVASEFAGRGSVGLVARTTSGALRYYPVPGNSTFGNPSTFGNGWGSFLIAGGENINTNAPAVKPPATTPPPVVAPKANPSIKSASDVVAADGTGKLWRYPVISAKMGARTQIGAGFTGIKSVHVTDWNADGVLDLIVQRTNGQLALYRGAAAGSFESSITLAASGWAGYDMTVGQWIKGGKFPSIVAQAADGSLTSFTTTNGTSLALGTTVTQGMTRMHPVMTDFDGDGNADIAAINNLGQLTLYRSNGKGQLVAEARRVIGSGWNGMTSVGAATAFTSVASRGFLARSASGALMYYPTAKSAFGTASTLATGWNGNTVAGSARLAPQQAITSIADVVTADSNGILWNSFSPGNASLAAPYPIGVGWKGLKSLHVVDWNSDGVPDVLAQWASGALSVYPGLKGGGFAAPMVLAKSGWQAITFVTGKWVSGARYPGLVGTNSAGELHYWANPAGRSVATAVKIGVGWGPLRIAMQDFDWDGKQDLLAVDNTGAMRLYRSNGMGGFISEARQIVGTGWASFKQFGGTDGFAGSNSHGMMTYSASGQVRYYPIMSARRWGTATTLGQQVTGATFAY